jgi:hypothetical protein
MVPLRGLFVRKAVVREHPLFGAIIFTPGRGWERKDFDFWGFRGVQLMIDAGPDGPNPAQEAAFRRLHDRQAQLLPQCLAEVASRRAETERPLGEAFLSTLSIPALGPDGPAATGDLWTIWFDYQGEEHWMYGVQSSDDWRTIAGFAED